MNREERVLIARGARRELARRSFAWYARHVWSYVPMNRTFVPSVAFDAVCAALQAVADGRIKRLGIAQPPGTAKSTLGAVVFPSWLQLKTDGGERVMVGSYSHKFALRDATKCRDLMTSSVHQELVGDAWRIRRYPDRVDDFWLTGGGRRVIVSPESATGERCTIQIIDDPLDGSKIYSETHKERAIRWIATTLTGRLEHQDCPRVLIMQRLCNDDPMSWAIAQKWKILDLTAIFGRDANLDPIVDAVPVELYDDAGELVWRDPRTPGDTLSSLLDETALRKIRESMAAGPFAAQYLQRPQDDSAAVFRRAWFRRSYPEGAPPECERTLISLDASYKESNDSDYAVIQAWGAIGSDRYLLDQWRERAGFVDTLAALRDFMERFPAARVLVEAGANGYAIVDQLRRELGDGVIEEVSASGGKMARAQAVAPIAERGCVVLPARAVWVPHVLAEVCAYPNANHDDQLDAMCYALIALDDRATAWPDYGALSRARW